MIPLPEWWTQLREGTRDQVIGGLIVAGIVALIGWMSRYTILGLFKRPASPAIEPVPPAVEHTPQKVILQVEQPAPPPPPPPPVLGRVSSPLPRPPQAGFVARRDESGRDIVEHLREELAPDRDQLIVLWGGGGVGKTTLAAQTARTMRNVFEGGIIWTSADGKPDYSLSTLLDEIATHLDRPDLRQLAPEPKDQEIHLALSRAPTPLIVLDNFETISPEEQKKCAGWLANRASGPALITSRDEVPYARPIHILAMSLPEAREFLNALISVARNPKVFGELDQDEIIQAADRIPLVLQWVVKRIDSARQPASVIHELTHGESDAAKRVFDRSFDLPQVGEDGRATLLALSLFVSSASRVALCEVAGFGDEIERLESATEQLAELWLIQTTDRNDRVKVDGLTRELTKARLNTDTHLEDYHRRFVAYFRGYAEAHARTTSQDYDALEVERVNLLKAMDMAFEARDWKSVQIFAYKIALPVRGMLGVRGYWTEALKANQQAVEAARESNSQDEVSDFTHNLAVMYAFRGELLESEKLYNESLEIDRKSDNQSGVAITLHQLARLAHDRGELEEAQRLYTESLEIKKKLDDQRGIAKALHQLAVLAHDRAEFTEARRLYDESLEIKKKLDDPQGIAISLHQLALLAYDKGEFAEALRLHNESIDLARKLGDQNGIACSLHELGRLAEINGDRNEAARLYAEALVIFEKLKSPHASMTKGKLERVMRKASDK